MSKKLVIPGEFLAVSEEYMAGEGTYDQDGKIYSAFVGELVLDHGTKVARVKPFNPPAELRKGDIVYGAVTDIRESMATVELSCADHTDRGITGDTEASLHISKISTGYTSDIRNEMRIGDIIRAVVIQTKPSLQLATDRKDLGVLKALCAWCRLPLVKKGKQLYCESCERTESRKTAIDYSDPSS